MSLSKKIFNVTFSMLTLSHILSASKLPNPPKRWPEGVEYVLNSPEIQDAMDQGLLRKKVYKLQIKEVNKEIGLGVFALEDIVQGGIIREYTGEMRVVQPGGETPSYAAHIGAVFPDGHIALGESHKLVPEKVVDAEKVGNESRLMNHCPWPNAYHALDEATGRVFVRALKHIKKGEQVTTNYGSGYWKRHKEKPQDNY